MILRIANNIMAFMCTTQLKGGHKTTTLNIGLDRDSHVYKRLLIMKKEQYLDFFHDGTRFFITNNTYYMTDLGISKDFKYKTHSISPQKDKEIFVSSK